MLKMKKLLSIVLAALMILSSVSIVSANTTEDLTITYWNADSTKITLDFSEEVDATALANAITLTKAGASVGFTVEKKVPTTTATLEDNTELTPDVSEIVTSGTNQNHPLVASANVAYEIYPAGGIGFDTPISLTVSAELTAVSGNAMNSAFSKNFKVAKLWKETFDNYETFAASPWIVDSSNAATLIDDGSDGKLLKISTSGGFRYIRPAYYRANAGSASDSSTKRSAIFGDTGISSGHFWSETTDPRMEDEYTLELEISTDTNSGEGIMIGLTNGGHEQTMYGGGGVFAGYSTASDLVTGSEACRMPVYTASVYSASSTSSYGYQSNGYFWKEDSSSTKASNYFKTVIAGAAYGEKTDTNKMFEQSDHTDNNLSNDIYHKVSMTVKDSNIRFGLNSTNKKGYTSYNFTRNAAQTTYGVYGYPWLSFFASYDGVTATYYVDNIVASKVVEFDGDDYAVTDWNANSSEIILDINFPITAAELKSKLSLHKGTEAITDFDVTRKIGVSHDDASIYTYVITPAGGLEMSTDGNDVIYTVDIDYAETYTTDNGAVAAAGFAPFSVSFKVNKLLDEGFNYDIGEDALEIPWNPDSTSSFSQNVGVSVVEETSGNKVLKITGDSSTKSLVVPTGRDNTVENAQLFADTNLYGVTSSSDFAKISDFNMEVKVKAEPTTADTYTFTIHQSRRPDTNWFDRVSTKLYASASNGMGYVSANQNDTLSPGGAAGSIVASTVAGSSLDANIDSDNFVRVSVFNKGVDTKSIVGSTIAHAISPERYATEYGMIGFEIPKTADVFYIDDIIYTRATEVEVGTHFSDMTVTSNGSPVENLTGVTTIDAYVGVINTEAAEACKVVMAIYDSATGAMKNVVVSPVTNIRLGVTEFPFDDVAVNGGDTVRIFFWKGLDTLQPIRNSVDWPAAQ